MNEGQVLVEAIIALDKGAGDARLYPPCNEPSLHSSFSLWEKGWGEGIMGLAEMLEDGVRQRLNSLPWCRKHYGPIIKQRLQLPKAEGSDLVSIFLDSAGRAELLEEQLGRLSTVVKNFEKMFDITLGNDPEPDERIDDRLFEVYFANYLFRQGYTGIEYVKASKVKAPDFVCRHAGRLYCIEVKTVRDRDAKDFDPIDPNMTDSGVVRSPRTDPAQQRLFEAKLAEGLEQIDAYVITHNLTDCRKVVAIWFKSITYLGRKAALENARVAYGKFSKGLDRCLLFLHPGEPYIMDAGSYRIGT